MISPFSPAGVIFPLRFRTLGVNFTRAIAMTRTCRSTTDALPKINRPGLVWHPGGQSWAAELIGANNYMDVLESEIQCEMDGEWIGDGKE
jgi:hypothetical protein